MLFRVRESGFECPGRQVDPTSANSVSPTSLDLAPFLQMLIEPPRKLG